MCVDATGTDLSYQWEYSFDGVNVQGNAGETGNTTNCITDFPAGAVDAYFRARITDANGCVAYSDWARLTQGTEPTLTIDGAACDANLTTYTIDFTSDSTVTSDVGTVSGNQVIDIPVGTDAIVTATLASCTVQQIITSPTCEPDCPVTRCMHVIITKNE